MHAYQSSKNEIYTGVVKAYYGTVSYVIIYLAILQQLLLELGDHDLRHSRRVLGLRCPSLDPAAQICCLGGPLALLGLGLHQGGVDLSLEPSTLSISRKSRLKRE